MLRLTRHHSGSVGRQAAAAVGHVSRVSVGDHGDLLEQQIVRVGGGAQQQAVAGRWVLLRRGGGGGSVVLEVSWRVVTRRAGDTLGRGFAARQVKGHPAHSGNFWFS